MSAKKPSTSRRTFVKGTAASAAIAPFFIGRSASAAATPEVTIDFGTVAPKGTPWEDLAKRMRKHIEKKSDGRIKIKTFLGGSKGDELSMTESAMAGRLGGIGVSIGAFASAAAPELECLEMPYLFKSEKSAQKALNANRQMIHDIMWDRGFKLLLFAENGYRSLGTTFPVEKPSDLKGRKIRTQQTKSHVKLFSEWNASAVPMGITEVLSSLQTGVVDGYDNTELFAFAAALYMATTHWTQTKHIYQPAAILLSRKGAWDKMAPDLQEMIEGEAEEMLKIEDRGFRMVRALGPQLEKNFTDLGIDVAKPDLAPFRKAAEAVHADFRKRTTKQGVALLDALKKSL